MMMIVEERNDLRLDDFWTELIQFSVFAWKQVTKHEVIASKSTLRICIEYQNLGELWLSVSISFYDQRAALIFDWF